MMMTNEERRLYLLSYFDDEPNRPEHLQDLILRVMLEDDIGLPTKIYFKKRVFLAYLRTAFSTRSQNSIRSAVNALLRDATLVLHVHNKSTKLILRGSGWRSRVHAIRPTWGEMSAGQLQQEILMGEDPEKRAKYIKYFWNEGRVDDTVGS